MIGDNDVEEESDSLACVEDNLLQVNSDTNHSTGSQLDDANSYSEIEQFSMSHSSDGILDISQLSEFVRMYTVTS